MPLKTAILILFAAALPLHATPAASAHAIQADGLSLHLDANGGIAGTRIGGADWPVSGNTYVDGFRRTGETVTNTSLPGDSISFTQTLKDDKGRTCTVTDRFTPDGAAVRWDVEITSPDAFWSAPVITRLHCGQPAEKRFWTAWGSPDLSVSNLPADVAAKVRAGKDSAGGLWSDPLTPVAFPDRSWHYGNIAQSCPVGDDYVALPLLSILSPATDAGLSLVLSPSDVLLALDLKVTPAGEMQFSRSHHRLGGGKTARFSMHLVPHEASWRGGLRFMAGRHPEFFEAPNPRVHQISGCGAYSRREAPIDVGKFKKMAFGFNWKLSDDFPYMGMFIPPVKTMEETWTRSCDEPEVEGQGTETSCRRMNDYAAAMKKNGFAVLSYFNVTEYGKDMYGRAPVRKAGDPELWKDPVAYLRENFPDAVFNPGIKTFYSAHIVDPGDPAYMRHLLEQAARNTAMLPATDGICIDRADWLRLYNPKADDGVTWHNGAPARSLFRSWIELMAQMGPQLHQADKFIFSNMMTMRLELCRELDGIYTEFGHNGNALNASALLGIRKPVTVWTYNETIHQPAPDAFMQRHLHMGAFPTAPYPNNNHCINPEPAADQLYLDYGPLLAAMRGKKWVLAPHCVETSTPGAKVNLFEVPGGYALPVTFGGSIPSADITLRNLPGLENLRADAIHPGSDATTTVRGEFTAGVLRLNVPLKRGCAMLRLTDR